MTRLLIQEAEPKGTVPMVVLVVLFRKSMLPVGTPTPKACSAAVSVSCPAASAAESVVVVSIFPVTITFVAAEVLCASVSVPANAAVMLLAPGVNDAVLRFAVPWAKLPPERFTICAVPSERVPS